VLVTVGVGMFKQLQALDTFALPIATSGGIRVKVYVGPFPDVVVDLTAVVLEVAAFERVVGRGHLLTV
jgi:multisubunit Na+/H+ antiporter MnhC subunit